MVGDYTLVELMENTLTASPNVIERGILKVPPVTYDTINASIEISWKYSSQTMP